MRNCILLRDKPPFAVPALFGQSKSFLPVTWRISHLLFKKISHLLSKNNQSRINKLSDSDNRILSEVGFAVFKPARQIGFGPVFQISIMQSGYIISVFNENHILIFDHAGDSWPSMSIDKGKTYDENYTFYERISIFLFVNSKFIHLTLI